MSDDKKKVSTVSKAVASVVAKVAPKPEPKPAPVGVVFEAPPRPPEVKSSLELVLPIAAVLADPARPGWEAAAVKNAEALIAYIKAR